METKSLIYTHQPEAYKNLSQFTDVNDFNLHIEMWTADIKKAIPKRQYNFIKILKNFMAVVPGVSTIRYKKLVAYCNDIYNAPTSERTAQRIMPLLAKFGIVKMYDSKMKKTGLRGANVIVWQPYDAEKAKKFLDFQNGGTGETNKSASNVDTPTTDKNEAISENGGTLNYITKANIINYYIRKGVKSWQSIACKMAVKKQHQESAPAQLIEQPVKPKTAFKPLKFISRLKDVVYKSLLNTKSDAQAFVEIVHANVYEFAKSPAYKPFTDELLEKALRIVTVCLAAHKKGDLDYIKSMRGFIDSRIKAELVAFSKLHVKNVTEAECPTNESNAVVDMYTDALQGTYQPNYNKGIFYDWTDD